VLFFAPRPLTEVVGQPPIRYARRGRLSHPDPHGSPDRTPIKVGEVWEYPVTGERATILERPWNNPAGPRDRRVDCSRWDACCRRTPPFSHCGAIHRAGGRVDREAQQADEHSALRRNGRHQSRRMARLVECKHARRAGTGGHHTRRAVRAHDRSLLRPSTVRAHRPQGHTVSAATRTECAGVQCCDRLRFASAGGATPDLWRTRTDRALARLSRNVPAALAHRADASDLAAGGKGEE